MNLDKQKMKKLFLLIAGGIGLYWVLENIAVLWDALRFVLHLSFPLVLGFCIAFVLNVPCLLYTSRCV